MKITTNNIIKNYSDLRVHTRENTSSHGVSGDKHNFDAITIRSNPRQIEETTFADAISRELSSEISSKSISEERLNSLKAQVQNHTYQIDAHAIASKILLIREDA